jgi:hypothetical protein
VQKQLDVCNHHFFFFWSIIIFWLIDGFDD